FLAEDGGLCHRSRRMTGVEGRGPMGAACKASRHHPYNPEGPADGHHPSRVGWHHAHARATEGLAAHGPQRLVPWQAMGDMVGEEMHETDEGNPRTGRVADGRATTPCVPAREPPGREPHAREL